MRVNIIGLPASGKTTLAKAISKKFSIPHIHIDRFWFESGGVAGRHDTPELEAVRREVLRRTSQETEQESWVSDGVFMLVQEMIADRADTIVFLDLPLFVRLIHHARRTFFEVAEHKEVSLWNDINFFSEIIRRTFTTRPKLLGLALKHKDKMIVLRSVNEIDAYLKSLT